jgi:hypothetical protein
MSKANKQKDKLPFGLTEDQAIPVEIKADKKTRKGFEVDLKPRIEKEEGAEYYYRFSKGLYHILGNKRALYTPGGKKVTVANEALAQRTVDHMNMYGEEYENPSSIVNFVFSWLDFFENATREDLENPILTDFETDWIHQTSMKTLRLWFSNSLNGKDFHEVFIDWVKTLTKHQLGGVVIMGATLSSVITAYLLSNHWMTRDFETLAAEYFNARVKHSKKYEEGFLVFWRETDLVKIFENYVFWQGLEA